MATVITVSSPKLQLSFHRIRLQQHADFPPRRQSVHAVPARQEIQMGRAATIGWGLNWFTAGIMVLFHVGALAALFLFSWQRLVVMAVLYVLAINVGIGMCYHRLLTHRGYHVPKWLEYVMSVFATLSLEGGPIFWVSTHRVHHQFSDQEGDPHTPREGGWWAHAGWILFGAALHSQTEALATVLARPEPRPLPRLAQQVSLDSHHC
jgi:fatty-acid desaturase